MTINVTTSEPKNETMPATAGGDQTASPEKQNEPAGKPAEPTEPKEPAAEPAPEKVEPSEPEEADESDDDADANAELDGPADKTKKKSGSQRRKERAERAEAEVARLHGLMEQMALKNAGDPKPEPEAEAKPADDAGKPDINKFDTHAEWVEAMVEWKADQKLEAKLAERDRKAEAERLKAEQAKTQTTYYDRAKAFAQTTKDFDEVLKGVSTIPSSPTVKEIIFSSENGPALAYELAKSPEEFARVCSLPPLAAAVAMGEIKARLAAPAAGGTTKEAKRITNAPAPLAPVGSSGKGAVKKDIYDPNLSQKEYEAIRIKQRAELARAG